MNTFSSLKPPDRRSRRRHSAEFKASVVATCNEPGVSIAAVALANGLNANLLRRWVIDADSGQPDRSRAAPAASRKPTPPTTPPSFIPLHLPAPPSTPTPPAIRIDLQRNGTAINISWPVSAAADCAAWLREWLR